MEISKYYYSLLIIISMICCNKADEVISSDELALVSLKSHITGSDTLATNWTTSGICSWIGVTCSSRHGRVSSLNLSDMGLSGTIPPQLGNLSFLVSLDLSHNLFSGALPQQLSRLRRLKWMFLEVNSFTGEIPWSLGVLSNLQRLWLMSNSLSGVVPKEVGNLSMINDLRLHSNSLTGVVPNQIAQLYNLKHLDLASNSLTGLIPPELFNISTLKVFSLSHNTLSGALPTNLCYASPRLQGLYLSNNSLTGSIPDSISNCSSLKILELSRNNFNGFIPQSLGNIRLLEVLNLAVNDLQAELESSSEFMTFITFLTNCTSLHTLAITGNPLGGIIPPSVGILSSSLQYFRASYCETRGSVPAEIGSLSNLIELVLGGNELSGNIPLTFKALQKVQGLYLSENKIGGSIPECLCQLHSLNLLDLGNNHFSGPIPECFGNLSSARYLSLHSNTLTSNIPSSMWLLRDLLELDLSGNYLTGKLPPEVANLVAAYYVNLSMNHFSGSIPTTIGKLQALMNLSIAHNRLEGRIPVSVGSMLSLISLDFSYNNLSGPIPTSIETLKYLVHLNVSFNALSGEIPTGGPFRIFTADSSMANEALCGVPRFRVPICHIRPDHRPRWWHKVKFPLAGMIGLIIIVSLTFIFTRYPRKDRGAARIDEQILALPQRISYYEILQATEHLNESNLIGLGSFGSVFKGVLGDGTIIAVKVLNLQSEYAFRSFEVECQVLRNIRHRNLTKVISSCSNEDFKAIVLEYMPNGNLERWLYSHNYCLDVMQRLNIMIDVASALEYLHHGYSTPIVHCDLKPSNVLLDEDMIAHVTDFGIAKMLGEEESTVVTKTLATLGYIAPEYGLEGQVSTRCDVYSYGVMLIEYLRERDRMMICSREI